MGTQHRNKQRNKRRRSGYRHRKPHGMKEAEFITRTRQIKRLEKDIEAYENALSESVSVIYPCEVTGKKQHTFHRFWTRSPRAEKRPSDVPLPERKAA